MTQKYIYFNIILLHLSLQVLKSQQISLSQNQKRDTEHKLSNAQSNQYPNFDIYLQKYNKTYDANEYQIRKEIYQTNIGYLKNLADKTYKVGVNRFTDLTNDQFSQYLTLETDYNKMNEYISKKQQLRVNTLTPNYPESLDWRDKNVITSVKNQSSCSSCWAFAAAAHLESMLIIKRTQSINIDLSEQFLTSCTLNNNCKGGTLQMAIQQVRKGIPLQAQFKYTARDDSSTYNCLSINKYKYSNNAQVMYSLNDKELIGLLQNGPVVISVNPQGWNYYESGVFECDLVEKVTHAALLIGYTKQFWIIKNSWSYEWGQNGYIRVTRNRVKNCLIGTSAGVLLFQIEIKAFINLFFLTLFLIMNF